jgi:hypothetical protein
MAELRTALTQIESMKSPNPETSLPDLRSHGPAPVWRSLLSPSPGQRALVLGEPSEEVIHLLVSSGVLVERGLSRPRAVPGGGFDFVLEEMRRGRSRIGQGEIAALLSRKGRWIVALHSPRVVGLKVRKVLSQFRKQGFGVTERYYAHASLWNPEVLVPLERQEPFDFFLRLTVGGSSMRRRSILAAFQALGRVGLHREFLPNCIVVARRANGWK